MAPFSCPIKRAPVVDGARRRYNCAIPDFTCSVRALTVPLKIVLFLLLLGFAARNSEMVTLRFFLGLEWQSPLSLVILGAFAIGLLIGLLACSTHLLRDYREIRALRRQLHRD